MPIFMLAIFDLQVAPDTSYKVLSQYWPLGSEEEFKIDFQDGRP